MADGRRIEAVQTVSPGIVRHILAQHRDEYDEISDADWVALVDYAAHGVTPTQTAFNAAYDYLEGFSR